MKKNNFKLIKTTALISLLLSFSACKKDNGDVAVPTNPTDQELITTVKLAVSTDAEPNVIHYYAYKDMDGDGGMKPSIDTIRLIENTKYTVRILVLDETKSPTDTTSKEILQEKNIHQFFFSKIGDYDLTTSYLDADDHGVPLGLEIAMRTGIAFSSKTNKYTVVLKHQPGLKPSTGNGDIQLGETDVEVDFPIIISQL